MRFSIVVPVYQVEKYLPDCIDSILNQTFCDYEIILVDDGSKDNSLKICNEYAHKDNRIRVFHKENGGVVSTRKLGVKVSKGDYVITVDSDDLIENDLLNKLSTIIDNYSPDVIKYNFRQFSGSSSFVKTNKFKNEYFDRMNIENVINALIYDKDIYGMNFGSVIYSLWTTAVKRELLLKYQTPVPDNIRMGEDLLVVAPLICNCNSIFFLDYVGYNYRVNDSSITHTFYPKELVLLESVARYLMGNIPNLIHNSICVYVLNMLLYYISQAAKVYNLHEFEKFINNYISFYEYEVAFNAIVFKKSFKDYIKIFLFKKKKFKILYFLLKRK